MPDLLHNNFTGSLIAFIRKGDEAYYCLAEVEYWIGELWNGYVNINSGPLEDLYFKYLDKFKMDYKELKQAYLELINLGDQNKLMGNRPSLYIDFDKKYFVSNFMTKHWRKDYQKIGLASLTKLSISFLMSLDIGCNKLFTNIPSLK